MSRSAVVAKHLRVALGRWPQDALRPESQLQKVLTKRAARLAASEATPAETEAALRQTNALYALLDNRFTNRYRLEGALLKPRSRPTYYDDIARELAEAPKRTFVDRVLMKLKHFIRLR